MQDYMRALHLRFKNPSQRSQELERETATLHKRLSSRLAKPERKLLLRLVDLEDTLRNQTSLDSFTSGFRLADGIHRELMEQPSYGEGRSHHLEVWTRYPESVPYTGNSVDTWPTGMTETC